MIVLLLSIAITGYPGCGNCCAKPVQTAECHCECCQVEKGILTSACKTFLKSDKPPVITPQSLPKSPTWVMFIQYDRSLAIIDNFATQAICQRAMLDITTTYRERIWIVQPRDMRCMPIHKE